MTRRCAHAILVVMVLYLVTGYAPAEDSRNEPPFWAEYLGVVEIERVAPDGPAVLVKPDSGLPLRLNTDGIQEWSQREGVRVEVEGGIRVTSSLPLMDVAEFSRENDIDHPISAEGIISNEKGIISLRTRTGGSVPLVMESGWVRPGVPVEVKGVLVPAGGGVAIEVRDVDYD
ncbi:MAG: hypothetical protein LUG50_12990 [Planctomycetaceae bacterium]|nr:hypothetical protein [Planctomycetaceae bacterium]